MLWYVLVPYIGKREKADGFLQLFLGSASDHICSLLYSSMGQGRDKRALNLMAGPRLSSYLANKEDTWSKETKPLLFWKRTYVEQRANNDSGDATW